MRNTVVELKKTPNGSSDLMPQKIRWIKKAEILLDLKVKVKDI